MKRVPHPGGQVGTHDPHERSNEITFMEHKADHLVQPSIRKDALIEGTAKGTNFHRNRYATQELTFCIQH